MRQLPASNKKKFWIEEGEVITLKQSVCEHVFKLKKAERECICKLCGLGFYIKPQDLDETTMTVNHPTLGKLKIDK